MSKKVVHWDNAGETLCHTGSSDPRWTLNPDEVTCKRCIAKVESNAKQLTIEGMFPHRAGGGCTALLKVVEHGEILVTHRDDTSIPNEGEPFSVGYYYIKGGFPGGNVGEWTETVDSGKLCDSKILTQFGLVKREG